MKTLRIGNGCGFWGDQIDAPRRLVAAGRLDYLTLEYLAELTMSILALQKQRKPDAGFATDFLEVLRSLGPLWQSQPGLKIVTNAGGMNPGDCARAARAILQDAGLAHKRVATVSGDDLLPRLDELIAEGHAFHHLDFGEPLASVRERVVSANAYLGAFPIAEALRQGADLVITGRVADASLTLGPCIHEFGWQTTDWDHLARGTVAGHLIECGAQMTGGLWMNIPVERTLAEVGYPIAEIQADGTHVVTKPSGTTGAVNRETVSEQLLYEVADPARYLTPDVVADFTSLELQDLGEDRVQIRGGRGFPAPASYKVSIAYRDGYMAAGTLVIPGPHAARKARVSGEILLDRLRNLGLHYQHHLIEVLGAGESVPGVLPVVDAPEVVLRVAVRDASQAKVERMTKEFAPLVTSGFAGTTGYTTGRPAVREVLAYWPAVIARDMLTPQVAFVD